jgi:hypothetical protein
MASAVVARGIVIDVTASPKAISDAVKLAVEDFLKTTFETHDQKLQDRFLCQVNNIVPDFSIRKDETCGRCDRS